MGQRYALIFKIEESEQYEFYKEEPEDPWLTFLVSNKWIKLKVQALCQFFNSY